MTLQQLKQHFGATHYSTMADGVTAQMVYKQEATPMADGTICLHWRYLASYAQVWCNSNLDIKAISQLKEIGE